MALIKCDECGKDVSDRAASCPGCGNPIAISEAVMDDSHDASTQEDRGEANSEAVYKMQDVNTVEKYKEKYSNLSRGLKRISVFASIIWIGYWSYNLEVVHAKWFGIYHRSNEYVYLGLFGLASIWMAQLFIFWIVGGFVSRVNDIVTEKEEIKEMGSKILTTITSYTFLFGVIIIIFLLLWIQISI